MQARCCFGKKSCDVMQEPSPSLEERIRAGTGMASSKTQYAINIQKKKRPNEANGTQSINEGKTRPASSKRSVQVESCIPIP